MFQKRSRTICMIVSLLACLMLAIVISPATALAETATVNVTVVPTDGGQVEGAGEYELGSEVTLEAVANEGWTFVSWKEGDTVIRDDDGNWVGATYTFTINGDRNLTASFKRYFDVTIDRNPVYCGSNITPVKVVDRDTQYPLIEGTDYELSYKAFIDGRWTLTDSDKNVGDYYVKVAGLGNYAGYEESEFFTINPAPLTITGVTLNLDYTGEMQGPGDASYDTDFDKVVTVEGLQGNDALTAIQVDGQGQNAGTYELPVSAAEIGENGAENDNYEITYVSGLLTINAVNVTVTTGSASKTYDGTALTNSEASITGLVNGETATVTATGSQTDAGSSSNTYSIDWGDTNDKNYAVSEKLGTLTVEPKAATITVENASKVEGTADPTFAGKVEGLVAPDDLGEITYTRTGTDENPGTYKGVLTATYADNPNYDVTVVAGDFTIEPAPAEPEYRVTSGAGGAWTEGSGESLTFKVERKPDPEEAFSHFSGVEVDGKAVPEKDESGKANWTARSGSVVVELQPSYLSTLSAGKHTLAAAFDDGDLADAEFTVKAAKSPSKPSDQGGSGSRSSLPKTSDPFAGSGGTVISLVAAGASLAASGIYLRRRKG